jgi:hypothetical protein
LLLRIQPSVREQIDGENTGHSLPRDEAPNKALLKARLRSIHNEQRNFAAPSL